LLFLMCGGLLLWLYYRMKLAKDLMQRIKEIEAKRLDASIMMNWDLRFYKKT